MHKLFIQMRDSVDNISTQKAVITQQTKYSYEKKAIADSLKVYEQRKVTEIELKQEKNQRYSLYGGLILVLVFAGFMFNRFKITQKQNMKIEKQHALLEEKNEEIIASIRYAKRIQDSLLTSQKYIERNLNRLKNDSSKKIS